MVGGVAYAAGRSGANSRNREEEQQQQIADLQAQQAQMQAQQYAPPPPPPQQPAPPPVSQQSMLEQLTELKKLLDAGVLTQAEFDIQKTKILQSM